MQRLFIAAALLLMLAASAQAQDAEVKVGPLGIEDLIELPGWFGEDFLTYQPQREYHEALPKHMQDVEILCILGTWCSDSKREVPRMIRLMQTVNIPPDKLKLIGVDRQKIAPGGEQRVYNIERVPTFIFLRGGKEIGRIVEAPLASLEKDMLGIIDPDAGKGAPPPPPAPVEEVITKDDGTLEVKKQSDAPEKHHDSSDVSPSQK